MTIMNDKIEYGEVEIPHEEFEPKNCKVRITIMIDGDLLDTYKTEANKLHTKYQTLMNQKLREALSIDAGFMEFNQSMINDILNRISALEQKKVRHKSFKSFVKKKEKSTKTKHKKSTAPLRLPPASISRAARKQMSK